MPTSVRIENQSLAVDVSPLGAEMQAITSSDGRSWLWNGDVAYWGGRSPVLFPIVGKAPGDLLGIDGKDYPMGQHGFARRNEFALVSSTAMACHHELVASEQTKAIYPFAFRLVVEHALDGNRLTVAAEVTNEDSRDLPFGIGFHPAFMWPLPGAAEKPHAVTLDNGGEPPLAQLDGGLIKPGHLPSPFTAGRLVLQPEMFKNDALIFPQGAGAGLRYGAEDGPALHFTFENLPNLALWTKPGAPFLCIEPWHGIAAETGRSNDIMERPYSQRLAPGGMARFSFTVEIPV
ncbi:aldose 1-epimerase family protein [Pararhizobium antarcticum]|uniref:Aldose epimerase n=1 Tax=Pararhizobium antarcticum TaxID=1798805 RepID=A0A657LMM4_9HYPH|nr:aldose 1-epimerase family protein [Pararhizobium antarcticum]OJF92326.1 aldose epimerase [Pararhizobium antarcticum]OJF94793.1 aldose epimerase [Rhizobium sp. 58]